MIGFSIQETVFRSQESGDSIQESGFRSQDSGDCFYLFSPHPTPHTPHPTPHTLHPTPVRTSA
ncbi:aspartyl-tRNA(Asn) amidotransferase subunit C [Microcystis aeruginosa NIES-44]|uniref:Aspartyl-tRNA(Asn) amidotransferase subunit C n=1 Tax=Microcystis aeruginosa NIES-44 TaxID=449439 RepID=A0A0A1VV82_MICAE|nr:aspartyl-tRNA(Asn) amidotransferase subunit C [Microcystis aeruginosa NIES-44]